MEHDSSILQETNGIWYTVALLGNIFVIDWIQAVSIVFEFTASVTEDRVR